ncbi:MAG: dihydrofolate reductase [Pseudomonadota bacterium]
MSHICLIAAVARNGAIGKGNDLLVRISEDQQRFRRETMGHPVVMGRKTWDSLPPKFRPLPGRRNIVVTRNAAWQAEGAEAAASLEAALAMAQGADKVCVIGGGELYAQALPYADELLLTEIDADLEGDTYFPLYRHAFVQTAREPRSTPEGLRYDFVTYRRQR